MVRLARTVARPLVASLFIASGLEVLANSEPRAKAAKPVVDKVASVVPFAPTDPIDAVRLNAAVHLGAGVLLAAGVMSRLAALSLAVSMVPTTIAGHPFWEIDDPGKRSQQRVQFLKNTAILGGLLVLALD
ncbi:MAG TPA: DoxX family protein [Candidatus Dormibacteraeota bacterium]|nr:DoxX family protein [Candidatus Dormibacteraeota bacterium]